MTETWLKPNRRALLLGMALPVAAALIGGSIGLLAETAWLRWVGIAVACAAGVLTAAFVWQLTLPRIGYRQGRVLFYLRSGPPIAVPLDVVEAFLMGQGPTLLPGEANRDQQTVTVVVRLAEKAEDWSHVDVKPSLASWCDGYITIRGTWCEPLDVDVVHRLNRQLGATRRREKEQQEQPT